MSSPGSPPFLLCLLLSGGMFLGNLACKGDRCADEAPSFQLDLVASSEETKSSGSLTISVVGGGISARKTYDMNGLLADGATSLVVVLEPAPTAAVDLELTAVAHQGPGGTGAVLGRATGRFSATPDACNQFSLSLGGPEPADGGLPDAPIDLGVDLGDVDAGDAGILDAEPGDADLVDGDGLDAEPADGFDLDGGPVDGGLVAITYPYAPSNFSPDMVPPPVPAILGCGETRFDTTARTFENWCGPGPEPSPLLVSQAGGPEAVLLSFDGFTVASGSSLRVVGERALILAIDGAVLIAGSIDVGARGVVPGPAGSLSACSPGTGGTGGFSGGGGGGGGGGGFGDSGGTGGANANGAAGGAPGGAAGEALLVPLRGGCAGGPGAGTNLGAGGAGGGALQISATDSLSVTGLLSAGGGGGRPAGSRSGGGGGGSGGGILLEATSILVTGAVSALGGGGGGGGADGAASGTAGGDALTQPGLGGTGNFGAGSGGDGSAGATTGDDGDSGDTGRDGGGGGGGGPGRIRVNVTGLCQVSTGTIAPSADGCS